MTSTSPDQEPIEARPSRAGRDLPAAILVGLGLVAWIVLSLVFWPPGFILLVVLMACFGSIEIHHALRRIGMRSAIVPIVAGSVAIIAGTYAAAIFQPVTDLPWHEVLLGCLAVTVLLTLIWRMPGGAEGYVKDAAASLFTISYIPLLASFLGLILAMPGGTWKVVTLALCVAGSDTGGYAVGATLGRHPMAPNISPKKTWEGMAGSTLTAVAVGVLCALYLLGQPWWFGALLGLACVVFGTAGDLIESLIKRDVGIKDMSSILPGHGGVLDRADSLLVAAPAAWLLFTLAPL
ncbi:MAG: phosphatidate cytidylyltransferase [Propionicimonas sp.]|nr:phosphatidate cytidylyltransferase [Propionicimonas sp.]